MATSGTPQGYQSQFIDSVPEDFYCKQCSLVAKELTITSCCTGSYCKACIYSIQQDNKPCPGCGEESFETFKHAKFQRNILKLQVYCGLKERGCGWCGALERLDTHLHPDTGDCEYTDVHCPFKCGSKIARNKINDHTANECVKRDYVCPYCAFKAIYETVSEIHWPECSYYPLRCTNRCGVTCERDTMEDHIKICPLQQVECEFKHVGCQEKFKREEEEEHKREKSQTHLTMVATASVKMNQELQRKFEEQIRILKQKLLMQEEEIKENLLKQKKFGEKLQNQEDILQKQEDKLQEQSVCIKELEERNKTLEGMYWKFTMKNFSKQKARDRHGDWKSPAMYTHPCGYKFCIGIDANGCDHSRGKSVNVVLWTMKGEFDDELKWPVTATFTIELINHFENRKNMRVKNVMKWKKPKSMHQYEGYFGSGTTPYNFIEHSKLPNNPGTQTQ